MGNQKSTIRLHKK